MTAELPITDASFDGSRVPEHIRGGIARWINYGIEPGSFLMALIENDLRRAFECADDINTPRVRDIVAWFYNHAPRACWGSPAKVRTWAMECAQRREDALVEPQ